MAYQVTALESFAYLADNVPSWLNKIDRLVAHTTAKHAEYVAEYERVAGDLPLPSRKRKNSSIHSLRPSDIDRPLKRPAAAPAVDGRGSSNDHVVSESKKVAPAAPVNHTHEQHPEDDDGNCMRPRPTVIISYDSLSQELFSDLVQDIGSGRNMVRKGRMSELMKGRLGSLGLAGRLSRIQAGVGAGLRGVGAYSKTQASEASSPFDRIDRELESAQSAAENGAYQMLRIGSASADLACTRERFEVIIKMSREEVERLKKEPAEEDQGEEEEEEEEGEEESVCVDFHPPELGDPVSKPAPPSEPAPPAPTEPAQPEPAPVPAAMSTSERPVEVQDKDKDGLASPAIEVDDNVSESSFEIDVSAIRARRMCGYR